MKLKTILVDDERSGLETVGILLEKNCPEIEIIGAFQDPFEAAKHIEKDTPDIVFLDISMPGMTGFELLDSLNNRDFEVIFTTAYDEYALEGFKHNALHYLVKPVNVEELKDAVNRAKSKKSEPKQTMFPPKLMGSKPRVPISTLNGVEMVDVEHIIRCESDGNYTTIVLEKRKITISKTLKDVEKSFSEFPIFFRLHNSHLVNINHVNKYIRGEGGIVVLSNNEEIGVSRSKKSELLEILGIH
jgi:two-component system, LytTR family, response regulator